MYICRPATQTISTSGLHRCIRQHTSEYVSIRQHTSAYVSIRIDLPRRPSLLQAFIDGELDK